MLLVHILHSYTSLIIRREGGRASRAVVEDRVASAVEECRARTRGRGVIEENEESHGQVTTHNNGDERGQGNVPIPT